MALVLAYGFFSTWVGDYTPPPVATAKTSAQPACKDGLTQYCKVGNCSGMSACAGNAWGGCKWERVCTPGSKVPCLKNNCPYALKECNGCGTGYGPCLGGNAS